MCHCPGSIKQALFTAVVHMTPSSTGTPRPRLNYLLVRSIITSSTLGTPELSYRGLGTTGKLPSLLEMSSIAASPRDTSELDRRAAMVIKNFTLRKLG